MINMYAHDKIRETEQHLAELRMASTAETQTQVQAPLAIVAGATGRVLQRVGTSMESWATASRPN